jgi:hypothetical protein
MMKNTIIFLLLSILAFPILLTAQDSGFGLGIVVGEPTGLSFKNWVSPRGAVDFAVAWSFGKEDALHVHVDYLFHKFDLFKVDKGDLVLFYGIGGRVKAEKKARVGVRIPIGMSYLFENDPLEIFFELGPVMDLSPKTDLWIGGGIGIRYYFD